jgi:hypothetical protein
LTFARRVRVWTAAIIAGVGIGCAVVGFQVGRSTAPDASAINSNTTAIVQRDIDDSHMFDECVFATLFVDPSQRDKVTEQKLEVVCGIDATHVEEIRQRLLAG